MVGVADDDGVGIGYVDAVLHDGGGEEHVIFVVYEADDDFLQLLGFHLSVTDGYAAVRHVALYDGAHLLQRGYAVADEIDLSVAAHLEVDGIADQFRRECGNHRVDGLAVGWGSAHDAHVPCPHERELERARYGRGRHGKCIDVGLQLAQLLFGRDAEFLFLIDDEQSEVLPFHCLCKHAVCAHEDVYASVCESLKHVLRLLGCSCSCEVVNRHGQSVQSLGECFVVLEGQYGGRHEHGNLFVVAGGFEGSPDCYLCLTKSHVAADEAVHRACLLHVVLHLLRGLHLVWGVLIEERALQLMLQVCVGRECEALFVAALGIELYEVAGNVLDTLLGALLDTVPCSGAEGAEARGLAGVGAAVLADLV